MPRVEITTEADAQAPPPPSDGFRTSESTSGPVQTIENSRTLVNTSLRYGFSAKAVPIKRYRMIQVSTCACPHPTIRRTKSGCDVCHESNCDVNVLDETVYSLLSL
jgi:hypothetical protein